MKRCKLFKTTGLQILKIILSVGFICVSTFSFSAYSQSGCRKSFLNKQGSEEKPHPEWRNSESLQQDYRLSSRRAIFNRTSQKPNARSNYTVLDEHENAVPQNSSGVVDKIKDVLFRSNREFEIN